MKEESLIEKVTMAWDDVLGDKFTSDLSDADLKMLADLLWAMHLDLQNEWVRRRMLKEEL